MKNKDVQINKGDPTNIYLDLISKCQLTLIYNNEQRH